MANTIYGNLPPIEDTNNTTEFFNNFYKQPTPGVSSNINDAVIGYFQSVTGDRESGITLAAAVLFTAAQQGITPMEVVDQFKQLGSNTNTTTYPQWKSGVNYSAGITVIYNNQYFVAMDNVPASTNFDDTMWTMLGDVQTSQNNSELTAYLTMFLNLNRQGTSLLGLSNQPQTNKYVTRAILP